MAKYASEVVAQAQAWLGCRESDGSHKQIIDVYNSHKPLARGYRVKYTDPWCAAFVSAVAVKLGYADIIPTECSCTKLMELLKALGAWEERDSHVPSPGDLIFYDWQDTGSGDNQSGPDHVGIVEKVSGSTVTVIEGNYSASVKRRTVAVNGRYIRGYGVPKYDTEEQNKKGSYTMEMNSLKKGCKGAAVKALQILLIGYGFSCGSRGVDGSFGGATQSAVKKYQKAKGLTQDGVVGKNTMSALLGVSA